MTLAAGPWPAYAEPEAGARRGPGALAVWRLELAKLRGQWRVRIIAAACLLGPFVVIAGLHVQSATPNDTAFGQWLHTSGFAVPLVILGFAGQWLLPVGTAIVAGDIFSSEDHFGTWKTILTRSRSRRQLFTGKFLAALTFALAAMALLIATSLLAAVAAGTQPVVGLGGQLVPAGRATELVLVSWLSVIPPVLGFTALAIAASVASRNSVIGIGVPVVLTLVFQIVTLLALPVWFQEVLLSTPFLAWHGFWGQPAYLGPFWWGLLSSALWFTLCSAAAWLVFRRRAIGGAA